MRLCRGHRLKHIFSHLSTPAQSSIDSLSNAR
jgi:hypothetical protein